MDNNLLAVIPADKGQLRLATTLTPSELARTIVPTVPWLRNGNKLMINVIDTNGQEVWREIDTTKRESSLANVFRKNVIEPRLDAARNGRPDVGDKIASMAKKIAEECASEFALDASRDGNFFTNNVSPEYDELCTKWVFYDNGAYNPWTKEFRKIEWSDFVIEDKTGFDYVDAPADVTQNVYYQFIELLVGDCVESVCRLIGGLHFRQTIDPHFALNTVADTQVSTSTNGKSYLWSVIGRKLSPSKSVTAMSAKRLFGDYEFKLQSIYQSKIVMVSEMNFNADDQWVEPLKEMVDTPSMNVNIKGGASIDVRRPYTIVINTNSSLALDREKADPVLRRMIPLLYMKTYLKGDFPPEWDEQNPNSYMAKATKQDANEFVRYCIDAYATVKTDGWALSQRQLDYLGMVQANGNETVALLSEVPWIMEDPNAIMSLGVLRKLLVAGGFKEVGSPQQMRTDLRSHLMGESRRKLLVGEREGCSNIDDLPNKKALGYWIKGYRINPFVQVPAHVKQALEEMK